MNFGTLWAAENNTLYAFGGQPPHPLNSTVARAVNVTNTLWRFDADGKGGGSWSTSLASAGSTFSTLKRPAGALWASGDGKGYAMGGIRGDLYYSPDGINWPVLGGLLAFDQDANTWSNHTVGLASGGALIDGGMHYAPTFGKSGVLVALGGESRTPNSPTARPPQPLTSVFVYDIAENMWYTQSTVGATDDSTPPPRYRFCMTGAQSTNSSYEIFMYGGAASCCYGESNSKTEVYVLSLPGFVWFKSNDTSASPRNRHTCEVGAGRQMISIGGLDPTTAGTISAFQQEDSFSNSLGIFDMVDLTWKNNYDANAQPYVMPLAVASWYGQR